MGLLRLLTNRRVVEEDALTPPEALGVYQEFLSDARIRFVEEPEGVEKRWNSLMSNPRAGGSFWTDAYLQRSLRKLPFGWFRSMPVCGGGPTSRLRSW